MFNMQAWSEEFFKQPTEQMSKETSSIFINMVMTEQQQQKLNIPEIQAQFLYQVIDKRAEYIGLELTDPAKIFLMFQSKSPGTAVMYLYALRSKLESVTMQDIAQLFPSGFPKEDGLEKLWDMQKGHLHGEATDNCLDSYQFTDVAKKHKP